MAHYETSFVSPKPIAEAFAYLAVRSLDGFPITFPTTTGVKRAMPGGRLASPARAQERAQAI